MTVLPKKTALTGYSYRLSHDHQQRMLSALDQKMVLAAGAAEWVRLVNLSYSEDPDPAADPDRD